MDRLDEMRWTGSEAEIRVWGQTSFRSSRAYRVAMSTEQLLVLRRHRIDGLQSAAESKRARGLGSCAGREEGKQV